MQTFRLQNAFLHTSALFLRRSEGNSWRLLQHLLSVTDDDAVVGVGDEFIYHRNDHRP